MTLKVLIDEKSREVAERLLTDINVAFPMKISETQRRIIVCWIKQGFIEGSQFGLNLAVKTSGTGK